MSDWFGERASALVRLRRAQTRVVTRVVPEIASEPGATATPGVLQLDGPRGGRYVRQRVCVERTAAPFGETDAFDAAHAEWNASGLATAATTHKHDGARRLDLSTPEGEFHSITVLHGGRVLQLTSFSTELDLPEQAAHELDDAATQGHAAAEAPGAHAHDDDAFTADTLAAPPDFGDHASADAAGDHSRGTDSGAVDPRPELIAAEERESGPDYGYHLRNGV